jgi:GT2 family glycosyltransferase
MNTHKIDVSIIIVNYNSGDLLLNCLKSIEKYTHEVTYELIIVDNKSIDDSIKKIENKFKEKLKVIKNKTNKGFGPANNQGLKIAKGDYILFLNNDTIFIEDTLKILLNYLKNDNLISNENPKVLVAPRLLNKDGTIQKSIYSFQTLWLSFTTYFFLYILFPKSKYFNKYYLMNKGITDTTEVEIITGAFMLFNKNDIVELHGFDEDFFFYGEDNDLCKRFRDNGGKIIYYPETKLIHLKGGTAKTNWFHEQNHIRSILRLFKKHNSLFGNYLAVTFFFSGNFLRGCLYFFSFMLTSNKEYLKESKIKFKGLGLILKLC